MHSPRLFNAVRAVALGAAAASLAACGALLGVEDINVVGLDGGSTTSSSDAGAIGDGTAKSDGGADLDAPNEAATLEGFDGSVLAPDAEKVTFDTPGTFSVGVRDCNSVQIAAWGAGGGTWDKTALGGAGGYGEGVWVPGGPAMLRILVGAPGTAAAAGAPSGGTPGGQGGAGGGGYSSVGFGDGGVLLVAGGGGGACVTSTDNGGLTVGGAGGGEVAQDSPGGATGGSVHGPGKGVGGGVDGAQFQGGAGAQPAGGNSGGFGATAGGGGGGGYFGGGGGRAFDGITWCSGGGGGSGFAAPNLVNAVLESGSGELPGGIKRGAFQQGVAGPSQPGAVVLVCR